MKKVDKPLGLGECLPDVEQRQLDAGEGANLAQNGITSRHSFTPDQKRIVCFHRDSSTLIIIKVCLLYDYYALLLLLIMPAQPLG
jgi:hypothetical protein